MATSQRATAAFDAGRCSSLSTSRSIQLTSTWPAWKSGWPTICWRKARLLVPPLMSTEACDKARPKRAKASSRVRPWAMTLAIIESKSEVMTSPSSKPVSMRKPGPPGKRSSSISPGAGAKSRSLSSALRRASMAWPTTSGGSPSRRSPAASRSCSFTRSSPVVASVTGCSTWSRAFTSMNTNCAVVSS